MARLREQLALGDWDAALRVGRALRLEEVAALTLRLIDDVAGYPAQDGADRAGRSVGPLTAREVEVLQLVSQGLSSKMIARQLSIAASTVNYHLATVFNKLSVDTRAQAVAVATQRSLL